MTKRALKRALSLLALPAVAAAAGAALLGGAHSSSRADPPAAPLNILVMGTDGRDTITAAEKRAYRAGGVACECADVLMLVHVSAHRDRVSVVSLPRDSAARIPAHRGKDGAHRPARRGKINGAWAAGGAELTVRTVEDATGLRVDRWLHLDFRRFMDGVDAAGGVEVCTARPLKDRVTALDLAPGRHRLEGGPALRYVRSRQVDASADLGRIQRQQRFLVNALQQLRARGALVDREVMGKVAGALLGGTRQGLDAAELAGLAAALHDIPASATEFTTVPIAGFDDSRPDLGSMLVWDGERAEALFARLRADRPLLSPGQDPEPQDPPSLLGAHPPVRGGALAC